MGFSGVSPDRTVKPPFALQWRTRLWSTHKAPMVIADGMVFSGGRLGNLTALDAATGAVLWKTHHPGVESRPGPTYVDGKLVILRSQGGQGDSPYTVGASRGGPPGEGVWCHDAATGKTLWHRSMPFRYHFNADGLAVHAGKVFVIQLDADQGVSAVALALDSGREVWRRPLAELAVEKKPGKAISEVRDPPRGVRLPPRFAVVVAEGLVCLSVSDRGTAALDPETGKVVWANPDAHITFRSRLAARNGVLVVFTGAGDQAFDAKTGKPLWKAVNPSFYGQALTDRYLESQGKEEVRPSTRCAWPVCANDTWYYHQDGSGKNILKAVGADRKTVWSHPFLSHACPSPSPANGPLYY
jgi:outer membrane protein assembly factor BamB